MTARADFRFFHRLRVRWAEVDPQWIVFNANYLMYFDVTMTEYMREIGYPYPDGLKQAFGTDMWVVGTTMNFRGSARFDDHLDIGARVARLGNTSVQFAMAIFREEELLHDGTLTYVNGGHNTKVPTPLDPVFIATIEGFETTKPTRKH